MRLMIVAWVQRFRKGALLSIGCWLNGRAKNPCVFARFQPISISVYDSLAFPGVADGESFLPSQSQRLLLTSLPSDRILACSLIRDGDLAVNSSFLIVASPSLMS